MALTPNGWPISPPRSKRRVPGTNVYLEVADGKPGDILMYVAEQFHRRVESLTPSVDEWGYSLRRNTNAPSVWSEHASATAIDLNAMRHPNGKSGTFTANQVREIQKIIDEVGGPSVVRWLKGFDEMHFEVRATPAKLRSVTVPVAAPVDQTPGARTLAKGDVGPDVEHAQRAINAYNGNNDLNPNGDFDDKTDAAVRTFQRRLGLTVDGIIGPATWSKLTGDIPAGSGGGSNAGGGVGTTRPALKRGAKGKEVADVQAFLNRYAPRYSSLEVDGAFGGETEKVVRELNGRLGLGHGGDFTSETASRVGYRNPPFDK